MKLCVVAAFAVVLLISVVSAEKCGECDKKLCANPGFCPLGTVKDNCNCCDVCGLEEGHLCDKSDATEPKYGQCGKNLECIPTRKLEFLLGSEKSFDICYCKLPGYVCATDRQTLTRCAFEVEKAKSQNKLEISHEEPCETDPAILDLTESQQVEQNSDITLACQVYAYPQPKFEWFFQPSNSDKKDIVRMPNNDEAIAVSVKSGPLILRTNGFLQINGFQRHHEGTYTCSVIGNNEVPITAKTSLVFYSA